MLCFSTVKRRYAMTMLCLVYRSQHSSPESGPNPKVNNHPESIWNMVWLFMPVEKNLFRKGVPHLRNPTLIWDPRLNYYR